MGEETEKTEVKPNVFGIILVNLQDNMANKDNNELEKRNQTFLIYQDENGIARVNVRFEGEDVWLNVEQSASL